MAAVARYLADTSAIARLSDPTVTAALSPLIEAGLVGMCAVVQFELLWSTRSAEEFDDLCDELDTGFERLPIEDHHWRRAIEIQRELWATGRMRSVPLPDLLIAAVAEHHRVEVLHYDADFDTIAAITGQPTRWVVPRGSVP
jgi:hypothetical protein